MTIKTIHLVNLFTSDRVGMTLDWVGMTSDRVGMTETVDTAAENKKQDRLHVKYVGIADGKIPLIQTVHGDYPTDRFPDYKLDVG